MAARRARLPRARWRATAPTATTVCPARLRLRPPARQLATATAPRAAGTPPLLTAGDLEAMTVTQLREHIQKHLPEMASELDLRRGGASKQQLMEDVLRLAETAETKAKAEAAAASEVCSASLPSLLRSLR